jgi:site-specific recombinase XerD
MDINHLEDYIPGIDKHFIDYCVDELQICSSRITRAKSILRKLNSLSQGMKGKAALMPDMSKKFDLPKSFMDALNSYLSHNKANGNRQTTIHAKYLVCGNFLKNLYGLGCTEIREVTGEQVQTAFLAMGCTRYWHERLSAFIHFLYENGFLEQNYSALIQSRRRSMPMPTVYSPEEIICVENSFDLSSPSGIRNYAITLLITRYGIRSCDIAALTFDNIDFEKNRIQFIQKKNDEDWESELLPEVKTALQNYIKNIRPSFMKYPNIFIKLTPPYAPLDHNAVNTMMFTQFQRAEIDNAERKSGSRALRSSVASNMINDGISTEIVRKVLGHGTKHALKHYARIDIESMRLCTLPVPKPTGTFAYILSGKGTVSNV